MPIQHTVVFRLIHLLDSREAAAFLNDHPVHVAFVSDRWVPEVAEFQEHDFIGA